MGVRVKALIAGILRYIIGIFPSQEFLLLIIVILHRNSVVQTPDITTLSLQRCVLDKNTVPKENTRHYGWLNCSSMEEKTNLKCYTEVQPGQVMLVSRRQIKGKQEEQTLHAGKLINWSDVANSPDMMSTETATWYLAARDACWLLLIISPTTFYMQLANNCSK